MRKIAIKKINATTPVSPGSIEIDADFTKMFQGKFYRNPTTGEVLPHITDPVPSGFVLIKATTFDIIDNPKYAGRYTVYTPVDATSQPSSFSSNRTRINVNEPISSGDENPTGYITNVSTYLLYTGFDIIVVPPEVTITSYPIDFMGRDSAGWGESFAQNFTSLVTNFANVNAPTNPFIGQTWYNTDDKQMHVWQGSSWEILNKGSFGTTYRHTQGTAAKVWTINHGLGLPAPHIAFCQFYVDRGNGPQVIVPSNVRFIGPNQMEVTFTNTEIGYVLVRQ